MSAEDGFAEEAFQAILLSIFTKHLPRRDILHRGMRHPLFSQAQTPASSHLMSQVDLLRFASIPTLPRAIVQEEKVLGRLGSLFQNVIQNMFPPDRKCQCQPSMP